MGKTSNSLISEESVFRVASDLKSQVAAGFAREKNSQKTTEIAPFFSGHDSL